MAFSYIFIWVDLPFPYSPLGCVPHLLLNPSTQCFLLLLYCICISILPTNPGFLCVVGSTVPQTAHRRQRQADRRMFLPEEALWDEWKPSPKHILDKATIHWVLTRGQDDYSGQREHDCEFHRQSTFEEVKLQAVGISQTRKQCVLG